MMQVGWLKNRKLLVGASIGAIAVVAVVIYQNVHHPGWAGFGSDSTRTVERDNTGKIIKTIEVEQSGKTLWDWLSLLGIPLSLAVLGFWLQQQQQRRADEQVQLEKARSEEQAKLEKARSEQQAKLEKEIANNNQQEEILQAYFDRLSVFLIDRNLLGVADRVDTAFREGVGLEISEKELLDSSTDVIRARTLSMLRRLAGSGEHKGSVIQFLYETNIIGKLKLSLKGADLCSANLCVAKLNGADLSGAGLAYADLSSANLSGADLTCADLTYANFSEADFKDANLRNADLSKAKNWTEDQLSKAKLCKTKLPEGCKLDPSRDCSKILLHD